VEPELGRRRRPGQGNQLFDPDRRQPVTQRRRRKHLTVINPRATHHRAPQGQPGGGQRDNAAVKPDRQQRPRPESHRLDERRRRGAPAAERGGQTQPHRQPAAGGLTERWRVVEVRSHSAVRQPAPMRGGRPPLRGRRRNHRREGRGGRGRRRGSRGGAGSPRPHPRPRRGQARRRAQRTCHRPRKQRTSDRPRGRARVRRRNHDDGTQHDNQRNCASHHTSHSASPGDPRPSGRNGCAHHSHQQ